MKINNKGTSLVELLVMITIAGIAVSGLLKTSQQALKTTQIIEESKKPKMELKESVYKILSNNCPGTVAFTNLSSISDDSSRVKILQYKTGKELFKFDPDSNKNKTKFGKYIEVVDMRLTDTQTFYLYYKYTDKAQTLGDQKTRNNKECTKTNLIGCYHLSCEMDIHYNNNCTDDITTCQLESCKTINCGITDDIRNKPCPTGKVLVSFTGDDDVDCVGCPENQVLMGIKTKTDGSKIPECLQTKKCSTGYFAVGTKIKATKSNVIEYEFDCQEIACGEGNHRVLKNGNMECIKICHGGQIPKEDPNDSDKEICDCPAGKSQDEQGNCVDNPTP